MDNDEINSMMRQIRDTLTQRINTNRPVILASLRFMDVTRVDATYDGAGDSGQLEEPEFTHSNAPVIGRPPHLVVRPQVEVERDGGWSKEQGNIVQKHIVPVNEAVKDLLYDVLEREHGGWEINEGSYGKMTWDIETDKISLVHNERIEDVNTTEDDDL